MKIFALVVVMFCCGGCVSASFDDEQDLRHLKFTGDINNHPYVYSAKHSQLNVEMFKHDTSSMSGIHSLQMEPNEITYRMKYYFKKKHQ